MRLLVLGGGPAGVSAALQARELGADVTLVEANRIGGTILSDGPAPVRTLARAARLVRDAGSWERFGLRGDAPEVDVTAALANAKRVADYAHEQRQLADVIRRQGVDLIDAAARPGSSTRTPSRSPTGGPSPVTRWSSPSVDGRPDRTSRAPSWR
jgi:pyruvate/2-oxoglutarate dehydrogenase complex dihydrolipoamide dehydrogenase (E3) component